MQARPLVLLSAAAYLQIYLILKFPVTFGYILIFDIVLSALVLISSAKARSFSSAVVLCASLLISCLVTYHAYNTSEPFAKSLVGTYGKEGTRFEATVDSFSSYGAYAQVFVTLTKADGNDIPKAARARLGTYSGAQLIKGDKIVFEGSPVYVSELENEDFNTRDYLRSRNVFIDFPSASITSSSLTGKAGLLDRLKGYTRSIIYRYIPQNNNYDSAAFCYAVFAGDKNLLPEALKDSFSKCGLTHILCVSGMHLAILAGVLYGLLSLFSLHKRTRCALVILLCVFYTVFTGFSLSTVRACIMCSVSYIGMMSGRRTDAYRSLFLSLIAICIISPYSALDISLQLSFCATLGICCFSEFIPESASGMTLTKKALVSMASMLLSNMGAVVFTLPVSGAYFGGISIASFFSTLAVSFIFEMALTCVLILLIISPLPFLAPVMKALGLICHVLSLTIIKAADFFSSFRYASVTSYFPVLYVILFVAALCALSLFISLGKQRAVIVCTCVITALGIVFSCLSLILFMADDSLYKLTYYRKNENNRQLSIKLGTDGYLLINADSNLCTDTGKLMFDESKGKNYLLIIHDKQVDASVLSKEISLFNDRFGLSGIFVTDTAEGALLSDELSDYGVICAVLPEKTEVNGINISYSQNDSFILRVDDGRTSSAVLFGDVYTRDLLCGYDNAAFFTRKTKNQFDTSKDTAPDCNFFFTRLKKDENAEGIINTNGEKFITIKG